MVSREWIENKASDILTLIGLLGGMLLMMFLTNMGFRTWGLIAYFVCTFGVFGGVQLYAFVQAAKYPYIEMTIYPEEKRAHLFIQRYGSKLQKMSGGRNIAVLNLAYPTRIPGYNQPVKAVKIVHDGEWTENVKFDSGWAFWKGVIVWHPHVERIAVYQYPRAKDIEKEGEITPVFRLLLARRKIQRMLEESIKYSLQNKKTGGNLADGYAGTKNCSIGRDRFRVGY
mgnify:CR=1 FL=1